MSEIDIIKKIEELLKIKLNNSDIYQLVSIGYLNNSNHKLIYLSLGFCKIDNTKLELIISLLKDLKSLTYLKLNNNRISDIFPLRELKRLKKLNLSNNKIKDISTLKELESLMELKLSDNQISNIFPLRELKRLKKLNLSKNRIKDISTLKELKSLMELELSDIEISDISPLAELKILTRLFLSDNKIRTIFPLKELKRLTELDLTDNEIRDISSLAELKSLTGLFLSDNKIRTIFPLKGLRRLMELDLSDNEIRNISPLKELKNLTELALLNNQITNISPLKKLLRLETLDLRTNPIKKLPKWIIEFNMNIRWEDHFNLHSISFYNNPLESPPVEIVKQGKEAIKVYYESLDLEEILYETKLVIVGRGFAGKTVLAKKLLDINYRLPENEKTTKGVVVIQEPLYLDIKEFENQFKYHLWDFGGQEKYDATHQFFITENSLYLFVTEARQESNYLDFDFWLNTIELFAIDAPVIVVMSKIDERVKELRQTTFKDRYKNIFDFEKVSCADGYEYTIEGLKTTIANATKQLKPIVFPSQKWKEVPNRLQQLAGTKDYISYNDFLKVCGNLNIDENKASVLSKYLHDLGLIIHRKDDLLLKNIVIINTDWCVDGAYKVLDNPNVFENKGFFSENDLKNIWQDEKYHNRQQELLNLMTRYKLCFELRDKSGYIIPNLLPEDQPIELLWDNSDNLFFEFRYDFMPAGLLGRFIVESHAFIRGTSYWKYGVVIEYEGTYALIEELDLDKKISIAVKGRNKKGLLNTIRMFFAEVHKDIKALVPIEMIPCNCNECNHSENPYFYEYTKLNKFLNKGKNTIQCGESTEDVMIQTLIDDILPKPTQVLISDGDLQDFIYELLPNFEHNINCKEGYSYLWRDRECNKEPKFETEIHPYICNLLEIGADSRGIQLSREVKENNGNIDVFFSYTTREEKIVKTCIEIKKAEHPDVETAVGTQLTAYLDGMRSKHGIYLVLWFKNEEYNKPKYASMKELEDAIMQNFPKRYSIKVKVIDCNKPIAPSKIK